MSPAAREPDRHLAPSPVAEAEVVRTASRAALRISLTYLLVGSLWILFSDLAAEQLFGGDDKLLTFVQTVKGWSFVFASGLLLHVLIQRAVRRSETNLLALHGSELRFRELMEQASDGILLAGADGRVLDVNGRACELFARPRQELLARSLTFLFPEDGPTRGVAVQLRALAADPVRAVILEVDLPRRGAAALTLEISASHAGEGLALALVRDISARRRVEDMLRASEARFRDLFEIASDAVVELDGDGRVQAVNAAGEAVLGRSRRALAGHLLEHLVEPADRIAASRLLQRADAEAGVVVGHLTWKGGPSTELFAVPVRRRGQLAGTLLLLGIGPAAERRGDAPGEPRS